MFYQHQKKVLQLKKMKIHNFFSPNDIKETFSNIIGKEYFFFISEISLTQLYKKKSVLLKVKIFKKKNREL
jgi:hypothetical protein